MGIYTRIGRKALCVGHKCDLIPPKNGDSKPEHDLLEFNYKGALGHMLAMEEHMAQLGSSKIADSWCLTSDNYVITNPTIKKIDKTNDDDLVLTHHGTFKKIVQRHKRRYDGEMYKITCRYSNIPITITPDHPLLAFKDVRKIQTEWREAFDPFTTPEWIPAKDLTDHDFLAFPRYDGMDVILKEIKLEDYHEDVHKLEDKITSKRGKYWVNNVIPLDFLAGELFGYYLAEGWTNESRASVLFSLGKHEKILYNRIKDIIKLTFGIEPSECEYDYKTTHDISIGSRIITSFFIKNFGAICEQKKIPTWAFRAGDDFLYGLLKGLIIGDGHIAKYEITMTTISPSLAIQVRIILAKLGYIHSLNMKEGGKGIILGRNIDMHDSWHIIIGGLNAKKLAMRLNLKYDGGIGRNESHSIVLPEYLMVPIRKIEKMDYHGDVYNLSVEGDESYTLIPAVVHNCIQKHGLMALNHHLMEAIIHLQEVDPSKAKDIKEFQEEFKTFMESPDLGELRRLRNRFREIIDDPTLKSECPLCKMDYTGAKVHAK